MALTIIKGDRHFEMLPGDKPFTHRVRSVSQSEVREHQWRWIRHALRSAKKPLGKLVGRPQLASQIIHDLQSIQDGEKLRRVVQPLTKLARASVSALHFRRNKPFDGH